MIAFATIRRPKPAAISSSRAAGLLCAMLTLLSCSPRSSGDSAGNEAILADAPASPRSSGDSAGNEDILADTPAKIACSVIYENMSPRQQKAHTFTVIDASQTGERVFVAFDYSNNFESPEEAEKARIEEAHRKVLEEQRARFERIQQAQIEEFRQRNGLPRGFEKINLEETKEIRGIFRQARRASLEELLGESVILTSDLTLRLVLRDRRGEIIASSPRRTIAQARESGFTYLFSRIALARAEGVELVVSTRE